MKTKLSDWRSALRRDERGLTTVEYAIVLCLIAAVGVATWNKFGGMVRDKLVESHTAIDNQLVIE